MHDAEAELRDGIPLTGRQPEPSDGLRIVSVVRRHHAEQELCMHVALFCRQSVPPLGLDVVLGDTPSGRIHDAELDLRRGVPLLGRQAVPPHGLRVVLGNAITTGVHHTKAKAGLVVTGVRLCTASRKTEDPAILHRLACG
jgi:hypothetical protein